MKDQLNDADKYDICLIDIISHYWKSYNGKLMLRITGLYGLGEELAEVDDVKTEYPETLALYLLDTCIGVKQYRKPRFFCGG